METIPNIASAAFKANPHPFYARLRAEDPIYRIPLPGKGHGWLITRYDDVQQALKDERFAKDHAVAIGGGRPSLPWTPKMLRALERNMLDVDPPDHTRLRGLVHKAFTPRLIEQLRERIQTLCHTLISAAQRRPALELLRDYALPLPITVIADMLGIPAEDHHSFHHWSKRIVAVSSGRDLLLAMPHLIACLRFLRKLFKLRRAHPSDDLTTALLQAEESGDSLTEHELVSMVFLLLVAGHETTVNLIASGTLALLEHPEQLALLRDHPELIPSAVEELLRYTSPVDIATHRYTREDVMLHGITIPRGNVVLLALGSANRDHRQFANPDQLDITRAPNRHLAFGYGPHFCLGAPLARLEGQIAIETLLHAFPNLRLTAPPSHLRWRRGTFVRGLEALPLAT